LIFLLVPALIGGRSPTPPIRSHQRQIKRVGDEKKNIRLRGKRGKLPFFG
jgi:hypothetical protein